LPSLIACLLVNRRRRIRHTQLMQMVRSVYPYLQSELYLGGTENLDVDVSHWLDHLAAQGLIQRSTEELGPPPPESNESYRLTLLAQIVMQMLERLFIAVGLLQQAGQHRIDRRTLENDCITLARRMSRLYGLNAPEFFDARLFRNFIDTLIARGVVRVDPEGRLSYADVIGEVTRASSVVLPADFRQAVMRARPQREAAPQPVSERAVPL
jgi:glycerol-3-phosphate O-acyltransferase